MAEYYDTGGYIPRIIHLAELEGEGLVCYDGNHRREVFNLLNDDSIECLVDVIFNASEQDVYNAFNNINKAVQLPAIYLENQTDLVVKEQIINLVREYETAYKPFLSSSARCHAPNFNRDLFTDNLFQIYQSLENVSIEQIADALKRLNEEYSNSVTEQSHSECVGIKINANNYKKSVVDKCKKYNFWLFIDKVIPSNHIKFLLSSH